MGQNQKKCMQRSTLMSTDLKMETLRRRVLPPNPNKIRAFRNLVWVRSAREKNRTTKNWTSLTGGRSNAKSNNFSLTITGALSVEKARLPSSTRSPSRWIKWPRTFFGGASLDSLIRLSTRKLTWISAMKKLQVASVNYFYMSLCRRISRQLCNNRTRKEILNRMEIKTSIFSVWFWRLRVEKLAT